MNKSAGTVEKFEAKDRIREKRLRAVALTGAGPLLRSGDRLEVEEEP